MTDERNQQTEPDGHLYDTQGFGENGFPLDDDDERILSEAWRELRDEKRGAVTANPANPLDPDAPPSAAEQAEIMAEFEASENN